MIRGGGWRMQLQRWPLRFVLALGIRRSAA
jgi:hypothetical protein